MTLDGFLNASALLNDCIECKKQSVTRNQCERCGEVMCESCGIRGTIFSISRDSVAKLIPCNYLCFVVNHFEIN